MTCSRVRRDRWAGDKTDEDGRTKKNENRHRGDRPRGRGAFSPIDTPIRRRSGPPRSAVASFSSTRTGRSRSAACCLIVSTPPGAGGGRPAPHGRRTTVLPLRRANAAPPRFPNRSVESRPTRQPARGSTGLPQRPEGKVSTTLLASLISFVRSGRLVCRSGDACLAVHQAALRWPRSLGHVASPNDLSDSSGRLPPRA